MAGELTTLDRVKTHLGLTGKPIGGITRANPGVVTCVGHEFVSNMRIAISGVSGMPQINGQVVTITRLTEDTFALGIDTSAVDGDGNPLYGAYDSGGFASSEDVLLAQLITDASAWFVNKIGRRTFLSATHTEIRDGNGRRSMTPRNLPVQSVTSVTIDGVAIPARVSITDNGWVLQNDRIVLAQGYFSAGLANVQLVYVGGYAAVPAEVDRAVIDLVTWRYRERDRVGLRSRTLGGAGGDSVVYMVDDAPPSVKTVIEQYQLPYVGG